MLACFLVLDFAYEINISENSVDYTQTNNDISKQIFPELLKILVYL